MSDDEERIDLDGISEEIEGSLGRLLDMNARLSRVMRSKANKLFILADNMERMAEEYRRIASLHVLASKEHAHLLADTIDAEYDITSDEEDDDDGEEDDTDGL